MKVRKIILICLMICATLCTTIALSACDGCNSCNGTDKTYTVSYSRGADDATGAIPATASYAKGATVTLAAANTFTRNGYTFENWSYGDKTYNAGEEFNMPANDVTFTAVWKQSQVTPPVDEKDEPTLTELANKFYSADNWVYMTKNNGAALDEGDVPYTLNDGSIKFHRLNQAIEMSDLSNSTASFMLKGTNDWSIWFNSSSKDNSNNYSYRLAYSNGGLRLVLSSAPDLAAAVVSESAYEKAEWNRFDIVFETSEKTCQIKLYINGERAKLVAGDNVSGVNVSDNVMTHVQPAMFTTGNYIVVKVWEAHNYLQLKPVAKSNEKDIPIIACIGASITEGAGAGNFYTESYPAQLQNALGGSYNVINFGKSGRTVRTDLGNEDNGTPVAWLENYQFEGIKAIKPDYAIFNIGTNDSKSTNVPLSTCETFKAAYNHLLDEVLAVNPQMEIFICTVPYAYSSIYDISNDNIRDIIAPVQRDIAAERGYTLIDLYNIVQNKSLLFGDGVHPNTTGYAMFVEIIEKVFKEGQSGLTQEFLEYIDEKYNDPEYELSNIRGAVDVNGKAIKLTVTGRIVIADTSKLRLVVETGTAGEESEVVITTDENGDFSATMDLATLTSIKWYNVRVYITDTFYYLVRLTDTDYAEGDTFHTDSKLVTVRSWKNGEENTFSFTVEDYFELTAEATIAEDNGKIMLSVSGASSVDDLTLSIDDDNGKVFTQDITVTSGAFTVEYDLDEVAASGNYYYVNLVYNGTKYKVLLADAKNGNGTALKVDDVFSGTHRIITVKTWNNYLAFVATNQADKTDKPSQINELNAKFYTASNWEYMTNNNGASYDGGDIVYALNDGSVKFHRENQAINIGKIEKASFMLRATDEWTIWFNSSSKDNNASSSSYRLQYVSGEIRLIVHNGASDTTAAKAGASAYKKWEWNRFDIDFATEGGVCRIKLYINEERVQFVAGNNLPGNIKVEDNFVIHTQPEDFGGNYMCVKVWEAHKFVQFKPVANKDTADVKIIAAIGASITAGANADNFYTESYPAQLQNLLGGSYNVVNYGNSGKTVNPNPGDGEPWMNQDQWKGVQAIKPDIIIVNIGTNDSKPDNFLGKDGFKTAYTNFINTIKAVNPDMEIYICTVPTAYSNSYKISNENIHDTIAVVQREVAQENGYHLIDLYNITQNKSLIFDDGIHPHSIGYGMFAEIIKKMITEGDAAITTDYLATIDAKYNDKVTNFNVEITTDNNELLLVVSGDTTLSESASIKVQLRVNDETYYNYNATISGGKFTVSIDLALLESAYYNIRVYVYDETYYPVENSFYHLALLSDTDGYTAGQIFHTDNKQVKLASWNSGWGATFSIQSISDYHFVELTTAMLVEEEGKINLTLSGTTGDSQLKLYVGNDEKTKSYYHDITVTSGAFTVEFDLATLSADGGWYNVRIYFADDTYFTVKYNEVKKADGTTALTTSDVFNGVNENNAEDSQGVKVSIKTWGSENPLSLSVETYDNRYSITATEVKFENGNLIFSGTVSNIETLEVYLFNNDSDNIKTTAELLNDGSFTVALGIEQLTAGNGNWYRLKVSADGKELENISCYDNFDKTQEYYYKTRRYYFANTSEIALVYAARAYNYTITSAIISEVSGKATLTLAGTLDNDVAATDVSLLLDKTSETKQQLTVQNTATEAGKFSFTYDISGLLLSTKFTQTQEEGYFMRLVVFGTNVNISSEKVKEQLFEAVEIGEYTYYFYRNSLTAYNTLGLVRIESSALDTTPVVTAGGVKFENGNFVFSGTVKNVNKLYVYLINTNVADSVNNYVEAVIAQDGTFTATHTLNTLAAYAKTSTPFNLRYKIDSPDSSIVNVVQGSMNLSQQYAYGEYTYSLGLNGTNVRVQYTSHNYAYRITVATITEVEGKATLTLTGTLTDTTIEASSLTLILNKTSATAQTLTFENQATEAGTFSFVADISEIATSTEAATNANHYFVRLYKDGTKLADINSVWAGDKIFEPVEIGNSIYYFSKNNANAYYTLGVIRVEKTTTD